MATSTRLGLLAAIVFAVVAVGAPMRAAAGARTVGDEPHYLLTALSLWEDHDLDVADERADVRYLPFSETPPLAQAELRDDGSQVEPHDPLLPVLLALPMGLGGWVAAKLALAAIAAAVAVMTAVVAIRRFAVPPVVARVAAGLAGASPPLSVYGTQVYPEIVAALAVLVALEAALGPPRRRWFVAGWIAVAALPWLSVKYAPVAAVAALGLLWSVGRRSRRGAAVAIGAWLAAGALFLVAHHAWYGGWTAYAAGSHFTGGELDVIGRPRYGARAWRLGGLLLDRHFGLAVWQPAAVALVPAAVAWCRRRPAGWQLLAALVGIGWANATFIALTMHGWWWPGRQVVVVVPLLTLALSWWAARLGSLGRRLLAAAGSLGVLAHACLVAGVLAGRHTLVVDFDRTVDPVVRALRPLLPDLRDPGVAPRLVLVGWVVLLGVWAVGLARRD